MRVALLFVFLLAGSVAAGAGEVVVEFTSDGPGGQSPYTIIKNALGTDSLEVPDNFHSPPVAHIQDQTLVAVGNCFLFILHRDKDGDPTGTTKNQRNEIKVGKYAIDEAKGTPDNPLTYEWLFKVGKDMKVSREFTHIFQLKSVGGDDSQPIITLTGAKVSGNDRLQLRYNQSSASKLQILRSIPWSSARNRWIKATISTTFKDDGYLKVRLSRLSDNYTILSYSNQNIDMWRGGTFVRSKYGIYRSLNYKTELNDGRVFFANFRIIK